MVLSKGQISVLAALHDGKHLIALRDGRSPLWTQSSDDHPSSITTKSLVARRYIKRGKMDRTRGGPHVFWRFEITDAGVSALMEKKDG